jgi:2-aminoadipate transaminase
LRDLLLQQLIACDSPITPPKLDQVIITAGSNQLLHLVLESILDPGDIVLCAAPTYFVMVGTIANVGGRSIGVQTDEHGLIPEALEDTLCRLDTAGELGRVRAIYLVTYFDNPCGVTTPADRVIRIVDIAKRWSHSTKIHVLADEAYRALRYAGEEVPSARTFDREGDTVVVAGTFSKSFSPGIRVGWGILPEDLVSAVCGLKGNIDFGSPNFSQHLIHKVLETGLFETHVARIRSSYQDKLQAMLDAAQDYLGPLPGVHWRQPSGGLYVWVELPEHIDTGPNGRLFDAAVENGVLYVPGQYCYPT